MSNPNTNLISTDTLNVTRFAAWGSGIAGVVAAVAAVVTKWTNKLPPDVVLALVGLAAVALVVLGAVVVTDMLVRRDLARAVVPINGNDPSLPLFYQVWKELKPDVEKAASALEAIAKDELAARRAAGLARTAPGNGDAETFRERWEIEAR
jgi:hypothetical protein